MREIDRAGWITSLEAGKGKVRGRGRKTVTCTIGELAAEDGVTITLATPVNAEMPGELVNQADLETIGNIPTPTTTPQRRRSPSWNGVT